MSELEEQMNIIGMLDQLANSLEQIEIKGRDNIDIMLGCMIAIDKIKSVISEYMQPTKETVEKPEVGEDEDGRQTDIGINTSNTDKE